MTLQELRNENDGLRRILDTWAQELDALKAAKESAEVEAARLREELKRGQGIIDALTADRAELARLRAGIAALPRHLVKIHGERVLDLADVRVYSRSRDAEVVDWDDLAALVGETPTP